MALKIQTLWRIVKAKRKVKALKYLHASARTLTRKLYRLCKRHKFHIKWMWQQQRSPFAITIQKLARAVIAKTKVRAKVAALRPLMERNLFVSTRLNQLLAAVQLQLIRDTLVIGIGKHLFFY